MSNFNFRFYWKFNICEMISHKLLNLKDKIHDSISYPSQIEFYDDLEAIENPIYMVFELIMEVTV